MIAGLVFTTSVLIAQSYTFNKENSKLKWEGKKVGGSHDGIIYLKSGTLKMNKSKIKSGKFVIDMKSMVNKDISNEKYRAKLENHLKSDDFFSVDEFPEAVLEITEESKFKDNKAHVHANLTIKGITKPVHFNVMKEDNMLKSKITVDRSKYNVKYGSKSFFKNLGDKLIYDDFTIEVHLKL